MAKQPVRESRTPDLVPARAADQALETMRRLQSVTEGALSHLSLQELLPELLLRLRGLLNADTIAILLPTEDGERLGVRAALGLEQEVVTNVEIPIGKGFAGTIAATRKPLIVADIGSFPVVSGVLAQSGIKSMLGAPLLIEERVVGVVHVGTYQHRDFTSGEADLLQLAADRIALAIDHARLYEAQVRATRELEERTAEVQRLNAELEARVRRRTAELETTNRELEAFSYSVSHDLRAPLRSIDGFSQVLVEDFADKLGADGREHLERIRGAAHKMAALIDALLQLSRVTRGELRSTPVNLSDMARNIVQELREEDPDRQVKVELEEGQVVLGDARLLQIALRNLLENAWKFTAGRSDARIRFGAEQRDGSRVFYVRDNGTGFNMAHAGSLFQPFRRLHGVQEFEGTGIGLATVQRVIARHHGRVWAESEPDRGATFYFQFGD